MDTIKDLSSAPTVSIKSPNKMAIWRRPEINILLNRDMQAGTKAGIFEGGHVNASTVMVAKS